MVNLISDTVTKPTPGMLKAMFQAEVGDDVFGEDPTINALQAKAAELFGHEAALFCPSGTMTNQIALGVHCKKLDEVICDHTAHIYQYETGGYAANSGLAVKLLQGENGIVNAEMVEQAINPDYDWLPKSRLVVLENTSNKGGGAYYSLQQMQSIQAACRKHGLSLHLDGARLFNALAESGNTTLEIGQTFDSISICLSKGLGAPVGSLLIGNKDFIKQAKRLRKSMGGGMRQAGYLAAAGIYALDNHIERLKDDHLMAQTLATALRSCSFVQSIKPVQTNIVIFDLQGGITATQMLEQLAQHGVKASAFGPNTIRFVTHLNVTPDMINHVVKTLQALSQ